VGSSPTSPTIRNEARTFFEQNKKEATMTRIKDTSKTQPKIKHIGKAEQLLDSKKITKNLGAGITFTVKIAQANRHRHYIEIVHYKKNGRRNKKMVYELLNIQEINKFAIMGIAYGMDLFHCIYIAAKHTRNFWQRVIAYSQGCEGAPGSPFYKFVICFYEKKVKR
jgi:hypothetical protein